MLKFHFLPKIRRVQFFCFSLLGYLFPLWKKPDRQQAQEYFLQGNIERLVELKEYLYEEGYQLNVFPFILQCNKQDLPTAIAPQKLSEQLGLNGQPCFGSIATQGASVFDTMKAIINQVTKRK